jgi:hypothetical protein
MPHLERGTQDRAPNAPHPPSRRDELPTIAYPPSSPWPGPDDTRAASVTTPTLGWEALAHIDALASALLTSRPTTPSFTDHPAPLPPRHPDTLIPDHPRFLSPHHPITPSPYDPTSDSSPLDPDDVAAMVADVLAQQARRHGVDLS